ncbi:MAG: aldo/keto reductase [Candidatus Odinarchaeota archaeon]
MELTINSKARLNNGIEMPFIGLGVYQSPGGNVTTNAVLYALEAGYRHVDTAKIYGNERDVGRAIREGPVSRKEIFVTTKLWNSDHGYSATIKACNESLEKLRLEYVDLYLIHWPVKESRLESWRAMETALDEGKCKAVGVSNYMVRHLEELLDNCSITPAVNQIELNPYNYLYMKEIVDLCRSKNIQLEAYSPLTKGKKLNDPKLVDVARKYSKTPAQILIRWALEEKMVVIPKSTNKTRIRENSSVFDFTISREDMEYMNSFNEDLITGWDPTKAP